MSLRSEITLFESAATWYMLNAIGSSRESNPSRRICNLRAVPLGQVADAVYVYINNTVTGLFVEGMSQLFLFLMSQTLVSG